jgi:hypothetical protein
MSQSGDSATFCGFLAPLALILLNQTIVILVLRAMLRASSGKPEGNTGIHNAIKQPLMKKFTAATIVALTAGFTVPSMGALFISAADISGSSPKSGYSGVVGVRFGVEAADIPVGQTVRVTELGFFAGKAGQFPGAGTVDFSHTVGLYGPRGFSSRSGDYSSLSVGSVSVPANHSVDADGWSWMVLGSPVDLVGGQYYTLVSTVVSGESADPYFEPFDGPSGSASLIAPNSIFYNGSGDTYMIGRYGLGSGAEAFATSGYLAANMKFEIIPEPSSAISLVCLAGLVVLRRRR